MDGRPTRTNGIQASEASKAMAENHHDLAAHIENFSLSEANAADHLPGLHHNAEHKNDNGNSKTTALTEINHNTVASVNETSSKKDSCKSQAKKKLVEIQALRGSLQKVKIKMKGLKTTKTPRSGLALRRRRRESQRAREDW